MRRSTTFGLERLADAVFPCDFSFEDIMISTVSSGRVLVTGFGPFGSERVNPSGLIAARLGGVVLPVAAEEAWIMTREEMKRRRARAVLALGVAGGRAHVCVEKQAVNEAAYPIADDAGRVLHGPLDAQRADRLAVTGFSAAGMARAMRRTGQGPRVSRDAGRYVCNHFYFMLLHNIKGRAVFVHLPRLPDEAARLGGGPGLSLEAAEAAVRAGLRFMERQVTLMA